MKEQEKPNMKHCKEYKMQPMYRILSFLFLPITILFAYLVISSGEIYNPFLSLPMFGSLVVAILGVWEAYKYNIRLNSDHIEVSSILGQRRLLFKDIDVVKIYSEFGSVKLISNSINITLKSFTKNHNKIKIYAINKAIEANPNLKIIGDLRSYKKVANKLGNSEL